MVNNDINYIYIYPDLYLNIDIWAYYKVVVKEYSKFSRCVLK